MNQSKAFAFILSHIPNRNTTLSKILSSDLFPLPENRFALTRIQDTKRAARIISKIDDVIEEVMKMEVLPVQSQFQGQFSVMGSSKIKGIYLYIYITYSFVLCSFLPSFIHCLFRCKSDFPILHRLFDLIPFFSISIFYWDALYVEKIMTRDSNKKLTIKTGLCMKKKRFSASPKIFGVFQAVAIFTREQL